MKIGIPTRDQLLRAGWGEPDEEARDMLALGHKAHDISEREDFEDVVIEVAARMHAAIKQVVVAAQLAVVYEGAAARPHPSLHRSLNYWLACQLFYELVGQPARLVIALPTITRGTKTMANFELPNDWILTVPITTTDSAGVAVPPPAGDVFSAVVSDPTALTAVVSADAAGNPTLVMTPLKKAASGVIVTLSDTSGLAADAVTFDIVTDDAPVNDVLDLAAATHTTQPVPAI